MLAKVQGNFFKSGFPLTFKYSKLLKFPISAGKIFKKLYDTSNKCKFIKEPMALGNSLILLLLMYNSYKKISF